MNRSQDTNALVTMVHDEANVSKEDQKNCSTSVSSATAATTTNAVTTSNLLKPLNNKCSALVGDNEQEAKEHKSTQQHHHHHHHCIFVPVQNDNDEEVAHEEKNVYLHSGTGAEADEAAGGSGSGLSSIYRSIRASRTACRRDDDVYLKQLLQGRFFEEEEEDRQDIITNSLQQRPHHSTTTTTTTNTVEANKKHLNDLCEEGRHLASSSSSNSRVRSWMELDWSASSSSSDNEKHCQNKAKVSRPSISSLQHKAHHHYQHQKNNNNSSLKDMMSNWKSTSLIDPPKNLFSSKNTGMSNNRGRNEARHQRIKSCSDAMTSTTTTRNNGIKDNDHHQQQSLFALHIVEMKRLIEHETVVPSSSTNIGKL